MLLVCYSYILVCYSYVTRTLLVCTRMLLLCSRVHSYVTRMYSCVTRVLLVCSFSHDRNDQGCSMTCFQVKNDKMAKLLHKLTSNEKPLENEQKRTVHGLCFCLNLNLVHFNNL